MAHACTRRSRGVTRERGNFTKTPCHAAFKRDMTQKAHCGSEGWWRKRSVPSNKFKKLTQQLFTTVVGKHDSGG